MIIRRGKGKPSCEVCGAPGTLLYTGVCDHVHGIQGDWNYRRCEDRRCGLVWLDPSILEADLPLLYADYSTHRRTERLDAGLRSRWAHRVRRAYVRMRFGRLDQPLQRRARLFGALAYLFPIRRMRLEAEYAYLKCRPKGDGRLLEIGCGNGERLQRLAACGWSASGIDFDALAVDTCRRHGLDVRTGTLEEQHFDAGSFDAIVLNHVIEHVADPVALLAECMRVARPGARLVMVTPNACSALHRMFGRFWRGLEAPRHLRIFSGQNLARLSTERGWKVERRFTSWQMTDGMFAESWSNMRAGTAKRDDLAPFWAGKVALLTLAPLTRLYPAIGEELVLELSKSAADDGERLE